MSTEEVRLAVPALPEYVRLARLTAVGLASRLGFTFDDVEDLRIAVDELCYLLVGAEGRPGSITLTFAMDGTGLVITGRGPAAAAPSDWSGSAPSADVGPAEFAELSEQILSAVVDEYDATREDGTVTIRMVRHGRGA